MSRRGLSYPAPGRTTSQNHRFAVGSSRDGSRGDYGRREQTRWGTLSSLYSQAPSLGFSNLSLSAATDYAPSIQRHPGNTKTTQSDYTNQVQSNRLNYGNVQYFRHNLSPMDISERIPSSIHSVKTNEPNMQIISDIPKERQTETRLNSSEFPACVPECSGNEKNIVDYCEQRTSTIYCGDQMFAGLANTDNNCCLNALLQTLFMTQNYEALLLRCQQKRVLKKAEDSIPYHLYKLFVDRHKNPQRIVPTHKFIQCLKLNHFNVGIQLDAEELFRSFFHLLQDQMKETGFIEAVNDLHMVTIEEFNSCRKCKHEFKQVEYMLTIPLSLCDTSGKSYETITNSLRDFFDYQLLDDDNKCHCDNCGEKTATIQYYRLLSCPQILCLQLKRFDLDPSLGTVVKNYDLMGFQEDLDLERFIDEAHSQKNKWQYKLLSVIVHVGSGTFGHYYAYVRNVQEMDWYYFNDERVRRATWKDVENTFGSSSSSSRLWYKFEMQTAYLLFYKRMD